MQKFENGDEVECEVTQGTWIKAKYLCLENKVHPVVRYLEDCDKLGLKQGCIDQLLDIKCIRPAQLICDEAREKVEYSSTSYDAVYKVECDSKDEMNELCSLDTRGLFIHTLYDTDPATRTHFKERRLPELNLKTGEVIPVEEDDIVILDPDYQGQIDEWQAKFIYVANELKEKDAEIERLNRRLSIYNDAWNDFEYKMEEANNL